MEYGIVQILAIVWSGISSAWHYVSSTDTFVREYGKRLEVTVKIILTMLVASQTGTFIIHQSVLLQLKPVQYNPCLYIKQKSRSQILGQRHVAVDTIYDTYSRTHSFLETIQQYLYIL